jgi:hypothetical protein
MERKQTQRKAGKRISLAIIARNKGMMITIARNCILRRDQNGSKKGKGGKQLQQQHEKKTWGMIQVMRLRSQPLV